LLEKTGGAACDCPKGLLLLVVVCCVCACFIHCLMALAIRVQTRGTGAGRFYTWGTGTGCGGDGCCCGCSVKPGQRPCGQISRPTQHLPLFYSLFNGAGDSGTDTWHWRRAILYMGHWNWVRWRRLLLRLCDLANALNTSCPHRPAPSSQCQSWPEAVPILA
jgi:hypothetical protein